MTTRPDIYRLAALVREEPAFVEQDWFHKTFAASPSKTSGKNPPPDPVCELIRHEMAMRGWTIRDLAARMEGDATRNRMVLSLYLSDPMPLGTVMAHRLGQAFGLPDEAFLDREAS